MNKMSKTVLLALLIALVGTAGLINSCGSGGATEDDDSVSITNPTTGNATGSATAIVADHTTIAVFDDGIPSATIDEVKSDLHIYYGHTSHGSQPITGMEMLGSPYASGLDLTENDGADLGHNGSTDWVQTTEDALAADSSINVVIWSWCGGVADNTTSGINTYLNAMNALEQAHPTVTFVYMTGRHWNEDATAQVDGESSATNTHIATMNALIRAYANTYHKVLFDFADIEEYAPDGTQHTNTSDYGSWCEDWCTTNGPTGCSADSCAHAHPYNCYVKGKAFWWMLSRIAGWSGE